MSRLLAAQRAFLVPAWGRDLLYRRAGAVPSLDIWPAVNKTLADITTGRNLVTFTRASSATYIDSDGAMKVAAVDVPRIDHYPVTGECLGLLIEEQRTNLLLSSEEFDNASWGKTNSSISANVSATLAPNGTATADKLIEDTSTGGHLALQNSSGTHPDNVLVTSSCYCKAAERSWVAVTVVDKVGVLNRVWFNLSSGTQGTTNGTVSAFEAVSVGNGWYRISVTASVATGASVPQIRVSLGQADNTASYTGDGTSGIYLWGAQLEAGAFPTSYIPTTSSAATRNADIASITGTNFSSWYNQTEGTIFAEYRQYATGGSVVNISDNTGSNFINIFTSAAANAGGSANVFTSGTNNGRIDSGGTFVANTNTKASYGLSVGSRSFSAQGNTVTTSATPTALPTVNRINIGVNQDATSGWNNGTIRRLAYWPRRLPDSILQTLTR